MKKYKLNRNQIINIVILGIIYFTWIISTNILASLYGLDTSNRFVWANLIGSIFALIFTIVLHYPLIPAFSKRINPRTENEAVRLRRAYSMEAMYTCIIGFFCISIVLILKLDQVLVYPIARAWGILELVVGIVMCLFSVFTVIYFSKMRTLVYVDKLQHKNADIESCDMVEQ